MHKRCTFKPFIPNSRGRVACEKEREISGLSFVSLAMNNKYCSACDLLDLTASLFFFFLFIFIFSVWWRERERERASWLLALRSLPHDTQVSWPTESSLNSWIRCQACFNLPHKIFRYVFNYANFARSLLPFFFHLLFGNTNRSDRILTSFPRVKVSRRVCWKKKLYNGSLGKSCLGVL